MKVYNAYEYFYEFGHGGDAEKRHIGTYTTEEAMLKEVMDKVEKKSLGNLSLPSKVFKN